jgi:hypothetical protein
MLLLTLSGLQLADNGVEDCGQFHLFRRKFSPFRLLSIQALLSIVRAPVGDPDPPAQEHSNQGYTCPLPIVYELFSEHPRHCALSSSFLLTLTG